jgi:methylenetetrahydrofolate dehydrogenase (NADP+)/methenyltetrahydrofolate cyclohydrolase
MSPPGSDRRFSMTTILKGSEVADALSAKVAEDVAKLKDRGVAPTLVIVRVGNRGDDMSYERGAIKRADRLGVKTRSILLPADVSQSALIGRIDKLNADASVHGVLLFRPLPGHIDEDAVRNVLAPAKDVDGITDLSLAAVFAGSDTGFAPCTAAACMEVLDHFGVSLQGKNVVVVGRSLVVGKPVAMMLLARHATVTVAHSRTLGLPALVRQADVVVACVGRARMLDASYLSEGQIVIDVGINVTEDGTLAGDVDFEAASHIVGAITAVPGGVGAVTTSVLMAHVVQAATRTLARWGQGDD